MMSILYSMYFLLCCALHSNGVVTVPWQTRIHILLPYQWKVYSGRSICKDGIICNRQHVSVAKGKCGLVFQACSAYIHIIATDNPPNPPFRSALAYIISNYCPKILLPEQPAYFALPKPWSWLGIWETYRVHSTQWRQGLGLNWEEHGNRGTTKK